MLILKLGGAGITAKETPNTVNAPALARLARALADAPRPLLLVHGAGSFGHILAKAYALERGYQGEHQRPALVQLQAQLAALNRQVIAALLEVGLLAVPYAPSALCVTRGGRIADFHLAPLRHALRHGLLPVVYGDCVWDESQGFSILSGDQLLVYLANQLGARRCAFGTNVDGVLDRAGRVIPRLAYGERVDEQRGAQVADVTGGMLGKLREIAEIQDRQMPTYIFNLHSDSALAAILRGQDAGTLIQG